MPVGNARFSPDICGVASVPADDLDGMFGFLRTGGVAAGLMLLAVGGMGAANAAVGPELPKAAPAPATPVITPQPVVPVAPVAPASASSTSAVAITTVAPPVIRPALTPSAVSLDTLVLGFVDYGDQDAEEQCLAGAVYFEARGEPLEGQLAVAQVVLNRAASGRFPATICQVVTQPAQFSFIRAGKFPPVDKGSECWHRALAIADVARRKLLAGQVAADVLWYHAAYVTPAWDREKVRVAQIGGHIFFS